MNDTVLRCMLHITIVYNHCGLQTKQISLTIGELVGLKFKILYFFITSIIGGGRGRKHTLALPLFILGGRRLSSPSHFLPSDIYIYIYVVCMSMHLYVCSYM